MATKNTLISDKSKKVIPAVDQNLELSKIDPQVKITRQYTPRRSYDTAYKLRILSAYDACETASERGALLRKEGLYYARIFAWKQQQANSKLNGGKKSSKFAIRTDYLTRENEQLKKKLAQA